MKAAKLSPKTKAAAVELGDRMSWAMVHARMTAAKLGRALHWPTSEIKGIAAGEGCDYLPLLVRLANRLNCDARWLVTGRAPGVSAGEPWRVGDPTPPPLPARPSRPGTCRYCGCSDDRACPGGCGWVDEIHTICSACLEVEISMDFWLQDVVVVTKTLQIVAGMKPWLKHRGKPCPARDRTHDQRIWDDAVMASAEFIRRLTQNEELAFQIHALLSQESAANPS
jgi:hypothetical protein